MNEIKNDIISILNLLNYTKKIAIIYYKKNSLESKILILNKNSLEDFLKYKESYLSNFIKMEIIEIETNLVDVYYIKNYFSLECKNNK